MKYWWISKKRFLFKLGSCICLMVALVMLGHFLVLRSVQHSMVVSAGPSGLSQSAHVSKLANVMDASAPQLAAVPSNTGSGATSSQAGSNTQSSDVSSQDLGKTLQIDFNVKDTRKVADNLLTWITKTDPQAISTGTDYEQVSDNFYNISLTFSVQKKHYMQIYRYLRDYTVHNGGHLVAFSESVQNVTSSYVDTQSRLKNLRAEQGRLQDLYSHAQALSDVLSIDQQLTDVEGQIESDEAQLNGLKDQIAFYTVSISLEPLKDAIAVSPLHHEWFVGQVFNDAFQTSLALGQAVLGLLIWTLAFGLYLVPLTLAVWLGRKWYQRTRRAVFPKSATDLASD